MPPICAADRLPATGGEAEYLAVIQALGHCFETCGSGEAREHRVRHFRFVDPIRIEQHRVLGQLVLVRQRVTGQ